MRLRYAALLAWLLAVAPAFAGSPPLEAARAAAASGQYALAAEHYQEVVRRDGFSAPVLFNLGNAWLRQGKAAPAILAYERALVLAPRSAPIAANLAVARQRAGIAVSPPGAWVGIARYFDFDTYLWTGLVALWVLCAAVLMLVISRAARRVATALMLLSAAGLCICADAAALLWPDLSQAVVQSASQLHVAPAASAASSGAVREGEEVWLQERYADFNFVRTADGHSGWLSAAAALPVRASQP